MKPLTKRFCVLSGFVMAINDFLLSGYSGASYFEKRKASYLYYIILSALVFAVIMTLGQNYFNLGRIYSLGNIITLGGIVCALFLFRKRKVEAAGHVIALSVCIMVIIETVVRDYFNDDPAIRYRLYVNMVALMGVMFIVISFFRDKKYVLGYAVFFELILLAHAIVIYVKLNHIEGMGLLVWEHLITVSMGMTLIAVISTWLLSYMEALFLQNVEYAEKVKLQKDILEKMVEERTHALQTSNTHLSEFAYIVSHDLKEPLRTISGFVTLIRKELNRTGMNDTDIEDYINYVTRGTAQMESLISDILAYSKLNVVEKDFEEVMMEDVVNVVKANLAKAIYESDAEIKVQQLTSVRGQKILIEQLFQNLISNAIKYRHDDRPLKITVGCFEEGNVVKYFVSDNGIGISDKYYDTIFKAFKRLHSKMHYEGTGVGLAICKKIIDIHGGEIWVESSEGEGSTFWVSLPAVHAHIPAMQPVVHAA